MNTLKEPLFVFLVMGFVVIPPLVCAQEAEPSEQEAMYYRYLEFPSYVKGGNVDPHWMADGSSFWYAEGAPANTVIYKVDPTANTKAPLFDTARLRRALTDVLGQEPPHEGLPFADFTFVDGEGAVRFTVEQRELTLRLDTYELSVVPVLSEEEKNRLVAQVVRKPLGYPFPEREVLAPDGAWFAGVRDYNLFLRSTHDGRSRQVTSDGIKAYQWDTDGSAAFGLGRTTIKWSPDSLKLVIAKTDYRQAVAVPIVHWLKRTEEVEWLYYPKAGGPYPRTELYVVDVQSGRQIPVQGADQPGQRIDIIEWRADSSELFFLRADWYGKKVELMAADAATGDTRVILIEESETFVRPIVLAGNLMLLEDGEKFIWLSERDGWNHVYLYGLDGTLIRRLTKGPFPVVRVVSVDEVAGWVYFTAQADKERIYDTHLYRVTLDGKGFTSLTEAKGQHEIQFAPTKEFFLDTHSTTSRPPVVEMKRSDGMLLKTVSKANIDALSELRWSPPEEFVVKAADGKTDLYGILYKPYDFDPNKKYPVIEYIDAAPGRSWVPRTFFPNFYIDMQALAQLGFIAFIVDGRGTGGRGREFQDVLYGNIGRYEIPDHVGTLRQLAEERPYMDLSRVGIRGYSYGGYMAVRAMLVAPEAYHVGVASAAISDMSEHRGFYMSPQENREAYEYASNLRLAGNLKGKLLLIHGTSDSLVPFSHTMKMVEALDRAGKPYDLVVLPERGHLEPEVYSGEYIHQYFQEHLKP